MTSVQTHHTSVRDIKPAPVPHADALQEAKRLEKMQTVCSSHRTSGTVRLPVAQRDDGTR